MAKDSFKLLVQGDTINGGDIIDFFNEILDEKDLRVNLNFVFVSNSKQKQLIKLSKIADPYSVSFNKDILVTINDTYYDAIDDDQIKKILMEQEIDKIELNLETGNFKLAKHSVSTNFGIVKKYTFDNVQRAIEVEAHLEDQLKNKEK